MSDAKLARALAQDNDKPGKFAFKCLSDVSYSPIYCAAVTPEMQPGPWFTGDGPSPGRPFTFL
jgi:hypothetical protein